MPVLVTGGTGFLGLNLVRLLVSQGQPVRMLVRSEPNRLGLESNLIEFARGDVTDAASVEAAMRGCARVYHLAAWVRVQPWGMDAAWRTNVEGTRNVCTAALKCGVRRLAHTSSIAALATASIERPSDETTPWNLQNLRIPYYITKKASEEVVFDFVRQGLDAVVVNPSFLVGPWDVRCGAGRMLVQIARRRVPIVPASGGINFVDVREAAAGHVAAMERGRCGERYFLGGENLTFRDFSSLVAAVARVRAPYVALPYAVMYPGALAGSLLGRLFPQAFSDLNVCVLQSAFLNHYASARKAVAELGFRELPIEQAVIDGLGWFAQHGYLPRPVTVGTA